MTSRQLAVPLLAALVGSAVTAAVLTATGDGTTTTRQAGVLAAAEARDHLTASEIYDRVSPSVVHVQARGVQSVTAPFAGGAAGPAPGISTGSGFVLDEEGRVVTNAEVVSGVTDVQVTFPNLRSVAARVVGKDEESNLAVLQVDPEGLDLRPLELGDSSSVTAGDQAITVGNPFGLGATAGTGVIAAARQQIETASGVLLRDVMQTDAVIEPATSGGPLIGADGRVIGIGSGEGPDGLGLAIPVNQAKTVLAELKESHKVLRPYLGLRGRTLGTGDGDAAAGVAVLGTYSGSPAEQAGLQGSEAGGSDVIEAVDGEAVTSLEELMTDVGEHQPGDALRLRILRDGTRGEVTVTLTERPASVPGG